MKSLTISAKYSDNFPDSYNILTVIMVYFAYTIKIMKTVLAIDDDEAILDLLSNVLEIEDTSVVTASNARAALKLAKKYKPAVILLDLMMPEYDGFEFFTILKQMPELSHTRFIMFTAQDTKNNLWESIDLSFDDFISKPFDLSELEIRIRHQLYNTEAVRVRR